jgi:hypothetical protein
MYAMRAEERTVGLAISIGLTITTETGQVAARRKTNVAA